MILTGFFAAIVGFLASQDAGAEPVKIPYCNSIQQSAPCVSSEEGTASSNWGGEDGQIFALSSYSLNVLIRERVGNDPDRLRLQATHLATQQFEPPMLPVASFELEISDYEPRCMAYTEYRPVGRRHHELAKLTYVSRGKKLQETVSCTFSRVYDRDAGYNFAAGVRHLSCYAEKVMGIQNPRWYHRFDFLIASENKTTANPCR